MKSELKNQKSGYAKVPTIEMIDSLLHSSVRNQLRLVQIDEVVRIQSRYNKETYISKSQNTFLTNLYIDVVLNDNTYNKVRHIDLRKKKPFKHVGMQMLSTINNN